MEEEIVTIGTFDNQNDIAILKSVFDDRKIWYFVADENVTNIVPIYSVATGGARLQVRKSDKEEAMKILEEIRSNEDTSQENVWEGDPEELEYFEKDAADKKGSARMMRYLFWIIALLLVLAFYIASQ